MVTTPGKGSSTTSMISVSIIGAVAPIGFLLRDGTFDGARRAFVIRLAPAFLADFFAFLETARFVVFFTTAFCFLPRFAVLVPARFVRLAITAAFVAIVRNRLPVVRSRQGSMEELPSLTNRAHRCVR